MKLWRGVSVFLNVFAFRTINRGCVADEGYFLGFSEHWSIGWISQLAGCELGSHNTEIGYSQ